MNPRSTLSVLRRAGREAPALWRGFGLTLLLAMAGTAFQIVVPILVQQIVDHEILGTGGVDVAGVVRRGAAALAAMALAVLAGRLAIIRLAASAAQGLSDLRVKTFRHLHALGILHLEAERRGAMVARVTSDVAKIQDFVDWGGVGLVIGSSQVVLAIGAMVVYEWRLALLVVAGVTVYAGLLAWFQRILARAHDQVRARVADTLAAVGETISGLPVVRAYGAERTMLGRVRTALAHQMRAEFRTARLGAALFSTADLFAGVITAAVIVAGILLGGISAGTLLAFLFLVNLLVDPVQTLVEIVDVAQAAAAGMRRILAALDTPIELPDPPDGRPLPRRGLDVRFDRVRFRYPSGGEALAAVEVHVPAGRRVAVVGETGSGKTTFAKLAVRLLDPLEGRIEVGGVPVDQVRFASLRERVAFVPQDGFLFDTTVAENVRYGRPQATVVEVRRAFADLDLEGWLDQLPAGLDTEVGERGANLSAGERQLVALVRAWIADPGLLVLDEATSAVDPALEVQLRRAIERLTEGRTSITIAHRLSTAEAAEEVLVFQAGRLVERGPHRELLVADGEYARLYADWTVGVTS